MKNILKSALHLSVHAYQSCCIVGGRFMEETGITKKFSSHIVRNMPQISEAVLRRAMQEAMSNGYINMLTFCQLLHNAIDGKAGLEDLEEFLRDNIRQATRLTFDAQFPGVHQRAKEQVIEPGDIVFVH